MTLLNLKCFRFPLSEYINMALSDSSSCSRLFSPATEKMKHDWVETKKWGFPFDSWNSNPHAKCRFRKLQLLKHSRLLAPLAESEFMALPQVAKACSNLEWDAEHFSWCSEHANAHQSQSKADPISIKLIAPHSAHQFCAVYRSLTQPSALVIENLILMCNKLFEFFFSMPQIEGGGAREHF